MRPECLRWWMIHRDRVWTLCCELLSSVSFFSRADSEKDDMPADACFSFRYLTAALKRFSSDLGELH